MVKTTLIIDNALLENLFSPDTVFCTDVQFSEINDPELSEDTLKILKQLKDENNL